MTLTIDTGDTTWMLIATGLVMMTTPALGFFESGLIRQQKLHFSPHTNVFRARYFEYSLDSDWLYSRFRTFIKWDYRSTQYVALENVPINEPFQNYATSIPGIGFVAFNMMVAVITPLLITGAFAEKMKWTSFCVFMIAWSVLIYCPLAHWVWGGGWLSQIGFYDFGGGIVVHVSAGMGSLENPP